MCLRFVLSEELSHDCFISDTGSLLHACRYVFNSWSGALCSDLSLSSWELVSSEEIALNVISPSFKLMNVSSFSS